MRTFYRLIHKCDILSKSVITNPSGQKKPTWTNTLSGQRCFVAQSGTAASIRSAPTIEGGDWISMILPYDIDIEYGSRVENIVHYLTGEVIYTGVFQVMEISNQTSFTGRVQHRVVTLKSVIE